MRTDELTEWMHDTSVATSPDLARITALGRRRRTRGRLVAAGIGVGVAAAVAAPFAVMSQLDQPSEAGYSAPPSSPTDRLAEPLGGVMSNLNKLYIDLPGDAGQSSAGLMSVWGESTVSGDPALHYGWKSEQDGSVHDVGILTDAAALAAGIQVEVVPSHRADLAEPTFVVSYPLQPGSRAGDYALAVEGGSAQLDIRTRGDLVPGFVVFAFSPLQPNGGVPDVYFLGLTGPDDLEIGVDLHHDATAWSWTLAEQPGD